MLALALGLFPAGALSQAAPPPTLALAQAANTPGEQPSPPEEGGSRWPRISNLELAASVAYGGQTQHVYRIELDPYGASFGLEPSITWKNHVRLGAYTHYSLGRTVTQRYEPLLGGDFELSAEASSLHAGLSIGYDLPLYCLVLRYALNLGFTRLHWDFGDTRRSVIGFASDEGAVFGFHAAPSLVLLWPSRGFEYGLGIDYLIQAEERIPMGVMGKLLVGVRR